MAAFGFFEALVLLLLLVAFIGLLVAFFARRVRRRDARSGGGVLVPPGWYPQGDGTVRYWDGGQWTGTPQSAP